jgi:hypothetical protein
MQEKANDQTATRIAYNKWIKPFGWTLQVPQQYQRALHLSMVEVKGPEDTNFTSRHVGISRDFQLQNSHPNRKSQRRWRIALVVALGIIFFPSLCITIPWILKKEKEEQDKLPLQKRTFTLQQYEDIKQQRAQFKRLLQSHQAAVEIKKEDKFKKICIGYDAKHKELHDDKEAIRTIDMFCDQEQAMKRWNPGFLAELIKKAESDSVKDRKEAFQAYRDSQAQSKQLKEQHTSLKKW